MECKTTIWQPCECYYIAFGLKAMHIKICIKRKKQPYEYATLRLHLSNVTYKECVNKCQISCGGGDNNIVGGGGDNK